MLVWQGLGIQATQLKLHRHLSCSHLFYQVSYYPHRPPSRSCVSLPSTMLWIVWQYRLHRVSSLWGSLIGKYATRRKNADKPRNFPRTSSCEELQVARWVRKGGASLYEGSLLHVKLILNTHSLLPEKYTRSSEENTFGRTDDAPGMSCRWLSRMSRPGCSQ